MFKLEKLELRGFKSFCDPTELVFNDGVTAIVGPNGCGKSNVVDAIAWVLGEQSAKDLRGGKMEDVIFNGTRDRKPVGMAEVVLTLIAVADVVPTIHEVDDIEIPEPPVIDLPAEFADPQPQNQLAVLGDQSVQEGSSEVPIPQAEPEVEAIAPETQAVVKQPVKRAHKRSPKKKVITSVSQGERVIISRRLYRSGESDYLLNGRQCRLRDIQELISGTGLGGGHYAIIEQGHIDRVLSSKPYERRTLIEDAAGVSIFKMKRRSAELRLESTRQNLSRLNDIINEIERQINSLKRQAAKARRYRKLREELRELLRVIFTGDYERITAQLERLATAHSEASQREIEITAALTACEAEHAAVVQMAREAEDNLNVWRQHATNAALEADRAANKRTFQSEQVSQFSSRLSEIEREEGAISQRIETLDKERERRIADLTQLDEEVNTAETRLRGQESVYRAELERLTTSEGELEKLRQRLVGEIGKTERLRQHSQQLDDSFQRVELQLRSLVAEGDRAAQRRNAAEADLNLLQAEIVAGEQRLAEIQANLAQIRDHLKATEETAEAQSRDLAEIERQRGAAHHRLVSLQDLDAHHAYYSEAVQHLFNNSEIHLLGTLADFIEINPQHEAAVESVLGDRLHAVLVPTLDDAVRGIEMLNSSEAGKASFVSVGLQGGEEDIGTARIIADVTEGVSFTSNGQPESDSDPVAESSAVSFINLLRLKPEFLTVIERVWPDLSSVMVVDNLQTAIHQSFSRNDRTYVTLTGEQVRAGSLIVGGSRKAQGASVLTLKREIKELTSQVAALDRSIESAQAVLSESRIAITQLRDQLNTVDAQNREGEKNAIALNSRKNELQRELERAEQHVRVVIEETAQAERDRAELLQKVEQIKNEFTAAEEQRTVLESELLTAQTALGHAKGQLEEQSQLLSQMRAEAAARLERRRACASEVRRMEAEHSELSERLSRNQFEAAEASGRVDELRASIADIESKADEYAKQRAETEAAVAEITKTVAGQRTKVDELDLRLRRLRADVADVRDDRSSIEIERARLSAELDYLHESCHSELNVPLEELLLARPAQTETALPDSVSEALDAEDEGVATDDTDAALQNSKERLEYLRRKLDEIGPVNLLALEELTESQQRFDFLTSQRKDILDSIAATEEALNEIKRRSRQRFLDAFAAINANFSQLFVELFGGGRGEMTVLEEDDILEAGIDIIAQPPGKRLQSVLLLSGGEKAMTALALTLAIFRYRPSPFCVLDEVDAPLDEVNTGRFCDKIIQMSEETQFLVITHTKRTMEAAKALYGVTMEEPGISKLVSVRFE